MIEIEKPRIETLELSDNGTYGKFVMEPLERGYATTLGNSMRRVLLSTLPGAAVTTVKIDGVEELSRFGGIVILQGRLPIGGNRSCATDNH